jgi:hypothetical protein
VPRPAKLARGSKGQAMFWATLANVGLSVLTGSFAAIVAIWLHAARNTQAKHENLREESVQVAKWWADRPVALRNESIEVSNWLASRPIVLRDESLELEKANSEDTSRRATTVALAIPDRAALYGPYLLSAAAILAFAGGIVSAWDLVLKYSTSTQNDVTAQAAPPQAAQAAPPQASQEPLPQPAPAASPQTQAAPPQLTIVRLDESGSLPQQIITFYRKLFEDSKITGDPEPTFYPREVDLKGDGQRQTIVRVVSPLTCSAQSCPIDIFSPSDRGVQRIFHAVAENVGYRSEGATTHAFPTIFTNVPEASHLDIEGMHVAESARPHAWEWDGDKYVAK